MNEEITSKEVRLIGFDSEQLGVVTNENAMQMAYDQDLDLVEVSPTDNTEVFEATIFLKDVNKGGKPGWGQSDVLYRSERMELKY